MFFEKDGICQTRIDVSISTTLSEQQGTELGNVNAAGQSNDSPANSQPRNIVKRGASCRQNHLKCTCALDDTKECLKNSLQPGTQPQNKLFTTSNA